MAVGDAATAAGYPLVPDTGEEGRVRWGGREINRTRDLIAATAAGISSGTADPTGGNDGDIYFKIIG
jgi:hypothetical protein